MKRLYLLAAIIFEICFVLGLVIRNKRFRAFSVTQHGERDNQDRVAIIWVFVKNKDFAVEIRVRRYKWVTDY